MLYLWKLINTFLQQCLNEGKRRYTSNLDAKPMKVTIEYLGFIRNMLSKRTEIIELREGTRLKELLTQLSERYGAEFKKQIYESGQKDLKYGFVVTVNGILMDQLSGVETQLKNDDHIILMSLMSGG